jgi:hypothetical protein
MIVQNIRDTNSMHANGKIKYEILKSDTQNTTWLPQLYSHWLSSNCHNCFLFYLENCPCTDPNF